MTVTVGQVGEKQLIKEVVRPIFDGGNPYPALGDDCGYLSVPAKSGVLVSTDRVPVDLIAFRTGVLDYAGLGRYLGHLNISDIIASGGTPSGILLNAALPENLELECFVDICKGFKRGADECRCPVIGGDISSSCELNLSATAVGWVAAGERLTRSGARPGDLVFITRPVGMTPAAFAYFLQMPDSSANLDGLFRSHLTGTYPLIKLGRWLAESHHCSACMDNTDGLYQSFSEIADESDVAVVIEKESLRVPVPVVDMARAVNVSLIDLALGPGLDLSLIGTLRPGWDSYLDANDMPDGLRIVGRVEEGSGVYLRVGTELNRLSIGGWDYFSHEVTR